MSRNDTLTDAHAAVSTFPGRARERRRRRPNLISDSNGLRNTKQFTLIYRSSLKSYVADDDCHRSRRHIDITLQTNNNVQKENKTKTYTQPSNRVVLDLLKNGEKLKTELESKPSVGPKLELRHDTDRDLKSEIKHLISHPT
ncbi:hypothetical protein EVAR_46135_1 [Eumeta japonica]|uniref:Uncharacterized protein n=1 Tax=Eumeta variegata TaxID=151549 RepID=A0A4C1XQ34_EUMVA|nr:hypothetical protein EVAR_46135_1 [Eumeta japonica]